MTVFVLALPQWCYTGDDDAGTMYASNKSSDDDVFEVVLGDNHLLVIFSTTLTSGLLHNSFNSARLQTL